MIGERLYWAVARHRADLAGRLTGMMLELDNPELLAILGSEQLLINTIELALRVLEAARPAGGPAASDAGAPSGPAHLEDEDGRAPE
eukprot:8486820-Lingulodinium_polyedra.AAC.1